MPFIKLLSIIFLILIVVLQTACSDSASEAGINPEAPIIIPPLSAPQNIAKSTSNGVVALSWSEVIDSNRKDTPVYNVYWNQTGNVSTSDNKIENVSSPYTVDGLTVGETYYFIVTTATTREESKPSFEVFAIVPTPVLVSIDITPADAAIVSGTSIQLKATGIFSNKTAIDLTTAVNWQTENIALSDINDTDTKGLVTANNIGENIILAVDAISSIKGQTTLRTQIDHSILGTQPLTCQNSGCHTLESSHMATSDVCNACHTTADPYKWKPIVASDIDHSQVNGTCVSCHDGTIAPGKSDSHFQSTDLCEKCHITVAWLAWPLSFVIDHNESLAACIVCHNGTNTSGGKTNNHIVSTDKCDA